MKLLAETDIESGLRLGGELTELRPRDIDFGTGVLTVSRVVVELYADGSTRRAAGSSSRTTPRTKNTGASS